MTLNLIQGKQINVNLTGSFSGSFTGNLVGSASFATSSSFATNAASASQAASASYSVSSSVAISSSFSTSGSYSLTSSFASTATSASFALSSSTAISSSFATSASHSPVQNRISSGSISAVISPDNGLVVNTKVDIGGNTVIQGTLTQGGSDVVATGLFSHAQGSANIAAGQVSHAEGGLTIASGAYSHTEGFNTITLGVGSHAEGQYTTASGDYSHTEGLGWYVASGATINTTQDEYYLGGDNLFIGGPAQPGSTTTELLFLGDYTTVEPFPITVTYGFGSININYDYYEKPVITNITYDVDTDISTVFITGLPETYQDIVGKTANIASGLGSHVEGVGTLASGIASHAEGTVTIASGTGSHAEGSSTIASGSHSHAEGTNTRALGIGSHAQGGGAQAIGDSSHAEGQNTQAIGQGSHTEGFSTSTSGSYSHAEGYFSIASGSYSHAEGNQTRAVGDSSHAEGQGTTASGSISHAEGNATQAIGAGSHTEGWQTIALGNYQHVQGQFNISSSAQSAFIIGNGTSNANRSNLVFASGSTFQVTGSVISTQGFTGSLFGTASWANNSTSSSFAISASWAPSQTIDTSSFVTNSQTSSMTVLSASFAQTASFAPAYLPLAGGTVSGSLTITNNLTVIGSASIQYITESTLNIGTNLITVNTSTPAVRFGGLAVIDSGSSPQVSASFLYDSVQDEFIFVHRGTSTSAITSSHFVLGPETYNNLGNETYLTANRIPKSTGNEHLNDSNISDNGSVVSINSNSEVTGSLRVTQGITGSLFGTSSWATNAITSNTPINVTGSTIYTTSPSTSNISSTSGIFLGSGAGQGAAAANFAVHLGYLAGQGATSASEAVFIGPSTGLEATRANGSIFLGSGAGSKAASASYSTIIGYYAGSTENPLASIGSGNIIIGNNITLPANTRNSVNIGAIIFATGSYSTLGAGNLYSGSQSGIGRVGINKVAPEYTLDVSGSGNYSNGLTVTGSLIATSSWASNAVTASYVLNSISSSFASTASFAPNYVLTSATSSMLQPYVLSSSTSSFVTNSQTSSMSVATASFVQNAQSASYVLQAVSSSFAISASWAPSQTIDTSSFVTNSQTSSMTVLSASFAATASFLQGSVASASFASTASSVNTLNQNVVITGSLTVGSTSIGSNENTLVVGPSPAGGVGEGGQILLAASGGTYTTASMLDNYQNKFRILRGTNASSDAFKLQLDMHTGQLQLPNYNSSTALTGSASGILGFSSDGTVLTTDGFEFFDAKPVIYQKHVNMPTFTSAAVNNIEGVPFTVGGGTARTWADTDAITRTQRIGLVVSVTGNLASIRQLTTYLSRNGGFSIRSGFNMAENATDSAIRFFIGLSTTISFSNIEPNTLLNCAGFCRLSTSNNMHIVYNDGSGTASTIDLGSNFPANTISTDRYRLYYDTVPSGIYLKIERLGTAFSYETTLTSDIPTASTGLNFGAYIVDTTGANVSTGFDWYGTYIQV